MLSEMVKLPLFRLGSFLAYLSLLLVKKHSVIAAAAAEQKAPAEQNAPS